MVIDLDILGTFTKLWSCADIQKQEYDMKKLLVSAIVLLTALSHTANATSVAISDDETAQVTKAITAWGCDGGVIFKSPSGEFEVEDATCHGGTYKIELGPDFVVTSIELE